MLATRHQRDKVSRSRVWRAAERDAISTHVTRLRLLAVLLLLVACGPDPSTPRGTAESFLDAHYVRIDLPNALPFTSGLAHQKVSKEIELVKNVAIDETTRKPTINYTFLEERPAGEQAMSYLYRGRIIVDGADAMERRWLLTVRQEADGWRVTNYQEFTE
jgi:hypothetical protein